MSGKIKSVVVKNRLIGGKQPNICIPLVAGTEEELIVECKNILNLKPDIIEWRVDFFEGIEDMQRVFSALNIIRDTLPDYPVIFTCRSAEEGGFSTIDQNERINLIKTVIKTGFVDLVDIELTNGRRIINQIIADAHKNDVYVIISHHNFSSTPPKEEIVDLLLDAQNSGADVTKVAVMPVELKDVLTLLQATLEFKEKHAKVPLITVSMSEIGTISRVSGYLFGSAITFSSGKAASAPGQIPISELRRSIDIMNRSM